MRLIDGDLASEVIHNALNILKNKGVNITTAETVATIVDNAPTVDAIPIDWVDKRINETADTGGDEAIELNNALFWTEVEWEKERQKQNKTAKLVVEPDRERHWHCSVCGKVYGLTALFYKFCPECGSKIEGEACETD